MRKIPIHQTIVLTEGAVVRPLEQQITVPDILATIRNQFENSQKIASTVEGFPEFVIEASRRLTALGK